MKPTEKQLTAMQILFDRNQAIIDKLENTTDPCQYEYCKALISVNDDIATELLATERQQLVDAYNAGQEIPPYQYAELYIDDTFKTQ